MLRLYLILLALLSGLCWACSSSPEPTSETALTKTTAPPLQGSVVIVSAEPSRPWPPPSVPPMDPSREAGRPDEGRWNPVPDFVQHNPGAPPLMFQTVLTHRKIRRDRRGRVLGDAGGDHVVRLVVWDPEQTSLHMVAGKATPTPNQRGVLGGGRLTGDLNRLRRVVAAFNGGWRTQHAPRSGMMVSDTLIRSASPGQATVATYDDGRVEMGTWPKGATIPQAMVDFRQNIEPFYADGQYNPLKRTEVWGFTNGVKGADGPWTVRSGLCRTEEGYGLYLWGEHMTHEELKTAMERARCAYGIHLDMNYAWATWEYYHIKGLRQRRTMRPVGRGAATLGDPRFFDWGGANNGTESPSPLPRDL
ncbi:MAG: hypothetical protein AAFS10_04060, partial [Myxococcota bacterium]